MAICVLATSTFWWSGSVLAENEQPAEEVVNADRSGGEEESGTLVSKAVQLIAERHSITADVMYRVELFGKKLIGKGMYFEERSGPQPLVRFELRTPVGEWENYLLRVSDGKDMWIYHVLMGQPRLDRIDIKRLYGTLSEQGRGGQGGAIDGGSDGIGNAIAFGGLAGFLQSLQESFVFDSPQSEELYSMPMWKLQGKWRTVRLVELLGDESKVVFGNDGAEIDLTQLPPQVPDHVYVWLGKDDLFPYRVEYCRGKSMLGDSRVIVAMQLHMVSFNVPMDKNIFRFDPSGIPIADRTGEYITRMSRRLKSMAVDKNKK